MKGSILEFNVQRSQGVISGEDGQRYPFVSSDWKAAVSPQAGHKVDFVQGASGQAQEIYSAAVADSGTGSMSVSMKKSIIAIVCAVLAFFIPVIGLVLSIVALIVGRQARSAAKMDGDDTAALVSMIAIVIAAISLIFAAIAVLSLLMFGSGLALVGTGSLL